LSVEIGHFALVMALGVAFVQAIVPMVGAANGRLRLMHVARPSALVLFVLLAVSFAALVQSFIQNDFTVAYVATHSNSFLPLGYRIAATWGGHEGSLLLWILMMGGWGAAVAVFSKSLPLPLVARVLSVLAAVSIGFLLFILLTSNPFERLLPEFPLDGQDLNPLLQDFGLIVHPPMLYMGYVGFSVAFAFAIAGLLSGSLDSAWARWSRPWVTIAWSFLTLGIALGSWWAYYELGWGGWWFWDPVENASFMPWLVGTALIHSLAATEKRGVFKAWTVLLSIMAFSLSLLGTFLVRSGVLTSVHAFANDPERGVFILGFMVVVVGSALSLFAVRASSLGAQRSYTLFSRELFLLINNIFLMGATFVVFIGTLYPLFADILGLGKASVGPPYFNALFAPMTLLFMVAMGLGVFVRWKRDDGKQVKQHLQWVLVSVIGLGFLVPLAFYDRLKLGVVGAFVMSFWVLAWLGAEVFGRLSGHKRGWFKGFIRQPLAFMGMVLAHLGFVVLVLGVAVTSHYSIEKDVRLSPGESVQLGDYSIQFARLSQVQGPNYSASQGVFLVQHNGKSMMGELISEKRRYWASGSIMTEAGINPGLFRDLYVALGEPLDDSSWAVRVYYKPLVRWLWLGAVFMAFGGILAVSDKRYRVRARSRQHQQPFAAPLKEALS